MNSPLKKQLLISELEAKEKLRSIGQEHLLKFFYTLSPSEKESLIKQIQALDLDLLKKQQNLFPSPAITPQPFRTSLSCGNLQDHQKGQKLVAEGKIALLVLAGGQGSRLRCKGPKGCVPLTISKHKTLFELLAEKIKAASDQAHRPLEVAIMTSPLNHVEIQAYFVQHAFFGLNPQQITFFYQRMWPFLDFEGNLFLESPNCIALGPNGNGSAFHRLVEIGIFEKWKKKGIEQVNVIPIDNPLADPFDFELFGFHHKNKGEVTIKAVHRRAVHESVGVLAEENERTVIVEYLHLPEKEKQALDNEGNLKFNIANIGLYCVSMSFIQKASSCQLPLHRTKKAVKQIDDKGQETLPSQPNVWKYEEFIFDAFRFADKVSALLYPREMCFAPLKNYEGEDSMESVQEALLACDRKVFTNITGNMPNDERRFELSSKFYYPTRELLEKWSGRELPDKEYIDE